MDEASDSQRRWLPGCLRAAVVLGVLVLLGSIALGVYLNVGVSAVGDQAQRQLDEITRALDEVPLFPGSDQDDSSTAVNFAHRDPMEAAEAERAVRADRLGGGIAFFFYCGDQCPAWQPGEAVTEYRSRDLGHHAGSEAACDAQKRSFEEADVMIEQVSTGSAFGTTCSFAGCIGRVAIRLDLRADEGAVYGLNLVGAIGDTSDFVDPFPDCE